MIASSILLSLIGLTAASPVPVADSGSTGPATQSSKGFRLVVNVTDTSKDFTTPVQNTYITSIHTGAGLALAGVIADEGRARIFYQNGTTEENELGTTTTITDGGTPLIPSGLKLAEDSGSSSLSSAHLDFGYGTPGVRLSTSGPIFLLPETYYACNESLPYYQGKYFIVIKQATSDDNSSPDDVPENCAPIRLVPECATLEDVPEGSYSNHQYALDSQCYQDVSAVQWTE